MSALRYGPLADMEKLHELLSQMSTEWTALRESLAEAQGSISERKKRNKLLRERLDSVKGDVSSKMNDLFGNILGVDVTDILCFFEYRETRNNFPNRYLSPYLWEKFHQHVKWISLYKLR